MSLVERPMALELSPGDQLEELVVGQLICEGSFGKVFTAKCRSKEVAIKVEAKNTQYPLLEKESFCLFDLNRGSEGIVESAEPFLRYLGQGETDSIRYLVMDYAGSNVYNLRKNMPKGRFSTTTALWILFKMLDSMRILHDKGWIHRDVKSGNFCIGHDQMRQLFVIDFGFCRFIRDIDGNLLPRRPYSRFYGTVRYSSLNTHCRQEMSRWDDLISVYYIAIENLLGRLPWTGQTNEKEIAGLKRHFILLQQLFGDIKPPESFEFLHAALPHLCQKPEMYYIEPPYLKFTTAVFNDLMNLHFSFETPLDWELKNC